MKTKLPVVLASQSPRRRELLGHIIDDFAVCPAQGEESIPAGTLPHQAVVLLALQKAQEVAAQPRYAGHCVIGADTVVTIDGEILGKPRSREQARAMLQKLSGRTHTVCTGMAVLAQGQQHLCCTQTDVTFYPLTDDIIDSYTASDEPYDKAGGYGIQGKGCILVESITGDYFNVMGLPVARLFRLLDEANLL